MNRKKIKLLAAFIIAVGGMAALIVFTMRSNTTSYMTPSQLLEQVSAEADTVYGQRVRIGGTVVAKTTKGSARTRKWEFIIVDDRDPEEMELIAFKETKPSERITVKYDGILPDTFQDGVLAIVDGTLDEDNVFTADGVLAKCPSKYEPSQQENEEMAEKGKADIEAGLGKKKAVEK